MSIYDRPFNPNNPLHRSGCICGRHRSPEEHDHDAAVTELSPGLDHLRQPELGALSCVKRHEERAEDDAQGTGENRIAQ